MKLLTKEILKALPAIGATSEMSAENVKVPLKLFNPCGAQSWFITEYNAETREAFGYVTGMGNDELGYISMEEVETVRLPFGLKIERDMHWDMSNTLAQVMAESKK
jgi:hypothetical protein